MDELLERLKTIHYDSWHRFAIDPRDDNVPPITQNNIINDGKSECDELMGYITKSQRQIHRRTSNHY